jgi:hypothetical protein
MKVFELNQLKLNPILRSAVFGMGVVVPTLVLGIHAQGAVPEAGSLALGRGISLESGGRREVQFRDICIELKPEQFVSEEVRATAYTLDLVKSREELSDRINFSASSEGGFGSLNAGAKSRFVKQVDWNKNHLHLLVRATRISRKVGLGQAGTVISNSALAVLRDSRFAFHQSCGQAFLSGIELGGEVFGLIEIQTSNSKERQDIEAKLRAEGRLGGFGGVARSDYARTINHIASNYRARVEFQHIGGRAITVPTTFEGLIRVSEQIESSSDAHPVPLNGLTRGYDTLSEYVLDERDPEVVVRQNALTWAKGKLDRARHIYAKVLYVLEYPDDFKEVDTPYLLERLTYLDSKVVELKDFLARGLRFTNPSELSEVELDLHVNFPELKWRASRRKLKVDCAVQRDPICGVESYIERESPACGLLDYREGTGEVCGVTYRLKVSALCKPKRFKKGTGKVCGPLRYKQCYEDKQEFPFRGRKRSRRKECGYEYKTCEHQSFGVAEPGACRHAKHGVEKMGTCKHPSFGNIYRECAHFSHGAAEFQACELASIAGEQTACPNF